MLNKIALLIILFYSNVVFAISLPVENNIYDSNKPVLNVALLKKSIDGLDNVNDDVFDLKLDYLKLLSEKLGLNVHFSTYETESDIYSSIISGDNDVTISSSSIKGFNLLSSKVIFSMSPSFLYESKHFSFIDDNNKWACNENSTYCNLLEKQGINSITRVKNLKEGVALLNDNKVNAVLDSYVNVILYSNVDMKSRYDINSPPWGEYHFKIITGIKNKKLLNRINNLLDNNDLSDDIDNIYYQANLENKKYNQSIYSQKPIRYSFDSDIYPLIFKDSKNVIKGYIPNILSLIESRSHLTFKYVPKKKGHTIKNMLKDGEIDMLLFSSKFDSNDFNSFIFTNPYLSIRYIGMKSNALISSKGSPIGILVDSGFSVDLLKNNKFDTKVKFYHEIDSLLFDLDHGNLSKIYMRQDLLKEVLARKLIKAYTILPNDFITSDLSFGLALIHPEEKELLNKIIATLDFEQLEKIKKSYSDFNITYGFNKSQVIALIMGVLLATILLFVIAFLWMKNLKLQINLKNKKIENSKKELEFLQNIINALPSQVFIHDSQHNILLSNCYKYNIGICSNCTLSHRNFDFEPLIENKKELNNVIHLDSTIHRSVDVVGCEYGMTAIDYYRKRIIGESNQSVFVLTVLSDISKQKAQEKELTIANSRAQEALESRELFLASMSHELRTPLAGMTGLLEMLSMRTDDQESCLLIKNIASSTHHLHLLVNDILDFSKLDAKQLKLDLVDSQIMLDVGELLRTHCIAARGKNLEFDFMWHPTDIKTIRIDPLRFSQIINNILSNAIKFTSEGRIFVEAQVTETEIIVLVTDTGEGMTHEQKKNVFKPFVQADSSIGRRFGGTGLGLTIVHDLIILMEGSIDIESKLGQGTTVKLAIPHLVVERFKDTFKNLDIRYSGQDKYIKNWVSQWNCLSSKGHKKKVVDIIDNNQQLSVYYGYPVIQLNPNMLEFKHVNDAVTEISSSPLFPDLLFDILQTLNQESFTMSNKEIGILHGSVLVAEDNPINQIMLSKQLELLGLTVRVVADGEAALELIQTNADEFDLLLTDCHMPVINGFELAKKIRENVTAFDNKAIIACTAEDSRVGAEEGYRSGFDDMLYKPYSLKRMYSVLKAYLPPIENVADAMKSAHHIWVDEFDDVDGMQLAKIFIETMTSDKQILISAENTSTLKAVVHRIKGGASTVGALEVNRDAILLESAINNSSENIEDMVERLAETIDIELLQLEAWLVVNG